MMKLILFAGCFLLTGAATVESIYTNSVTTIEGVNKSLSAYQGKKILIIITEDSNWQRIDRREILIKIEF